MLIKDFLHSLSYLWPDINTNKKITCPLRALFPLTNNNCIKFLEFYSLLTYYLVKCIFLSQLHFDAEESFAKHALHDATDNYYYSPFYLCGCTVKHELFQGV